MLRIMLQFASKVKGKKCYTNDVFNKNNIWRTTDVKTKKPIRIFLKMEKNGTKGKALCIIGARQTGKTTLIREFGKNEYEHFAEINFVTDKKAADVFSGKLTAEEIITNMTAYLQKPLEIGKKL